MSTTGTPARTSGAQASALAAWGSAENTKSTLADNSGSIVRS